MEEPNHGFDEFSVEMGDFEVERVNKFDRLQRVGEGGSVTTHVTYHDGFLYFGAANHIVYCVRPKDGKLVWKCKTDGIIMESNPVIADNLLFFGSFDHNVYALDAKTGKLIWKFRTGDKITTSPAVSENMVFIGSADHNIYAFDRMTGEVIWKFRTQGWVNSEPLVLGNKILIGSYDRFAYCLNKHDGKMIWKLETQGEIFNTTSFAHRDGVVYIPSLDGALRAADIETGRLLWKVKLATYGMASSGTVLDNMILQSTRDGIMYALDFNGNTLWKYKAREDDVIGPPSVYDGRIYVCSFADNHMHCVSLDGKLLWKFETRDGVYARPLMIGSSLFVASWDCNVYCIDVNTRRVTWKFKAEGSPCYVPPPHEAFELNVKFSSEEVEESGRKTYEFDLTENDERDTSEYKSTITYQSGTTYREKGKYQIDSREEAF
ncbi:MAG: PQQ-binding-like beta-propeller repeat protein [Candidatus Aenigmarchaeota archaeon]|nr:PQQ-binding-like beta-propeller repeat protein [Candidatus Aenigmarchaeota archaeon]